MDKKTKLHAAVALAVAVFSAGIVYSVLTHSYIDAVLPAFLLGVTLGVYLTVQFVLIKIKPLVLEMEHWGAETGRGNP